MAANLYRTYSVLCMAADAFNGMLTLSSPVVSSGYTLKCSAPYRANPPFLTFLTFGHSGAQEIVLLAMAVFFCFSFVFLVYVVLCLIVFGCQYRCNWLPGKTRLQNDPLCVEWDVKPYTLTHSPPAKCGVRLRRCISPCVFINRRCQFASFTVFTHTHTHTHVVPAVNQPYLYWSYYTFSQSNV